MSSPGEGPIVLIWSWNRPIYLWACLDSLYRHTRHPARFVLLDNGSTDPLVRDVVEGFVRRGMFWRVEYGETNSWDQLHDAFKRYQDLTGEFIVHVDGDVFVFESEPCWLTRMIDLMRERPKLAILGSYVDQRDFIDPADVAWLAEAVEPAEFENLVKLRSPERKLTPSNDPIIDPFNPPGRLMIHRTSVIDQLNGTDGQVYRRIKALGLEAGIATGVRHRHLSLLNPFDYPSYSMAHRERFFHASGPAAAAPKKT